MWMVSLLMNYFTSITLSYQVIKTTMYCFFVKNKINTKELQKSRKWKLVEEEVTELKWRKVFAGTISDPLLLGVILPNFSMLILSLPFFGLGSKSISVSPGGGEGKWLIYNRVWERGQGMGIILYFLFFCFFHLCFSPLLSHVLSPCFKWVEHDSCCVCFCFLFFFFVFGPFN